MPVIEWIAGLLRPVLNSPYILRVRRNHGLEHATIHMLNRQRYTLSGRSGGAGFVIYGDVPTDKLQAAVEEALNRFSKGQKQWAVHPNCGTNLVTTGFLATAVGAIGFTNISKKSAWDRFPLVMLAIMGVVLYSTPIGMSLQKHITTTGDMGATELISVTRQEARFPLTGAKTVVHHVITRGG